MKSVGLLALSLYMLLVAGALAQGPEAGSQVVTPQALGISFPNSSSSTVMLTKNGKQYIIDVAAHTIREVPQRQELLATQTPTADGTQAAASLFAKNCVPCHGSEGKGIPAIGTPNFSNPLFQKSTSNKDISDAIRNGRGRMPAWKGKLTEAQISELEVYVRTFSPDASSGAKTNAAPDSEKQGKSGIYQPGDDVLISLPTGRPTDRHGLYVNFAHRFAYDPVFTGTGRGEFLFGLDGFAIPSFGLRYGVTDKLNVSIYRAPSVVGRPIQLMAGYNLLDEHKGSPLNLEVRVSVEGQNTFRKNYTENIEGIFSRSITSRAQFYLVPTASFNDRPLVQDGSRSAEILDFPGVNALSMGMGLAIDIRPTVSLLAEVIPTLVNGPELGIHRPAFSFGIQKKIYRHAFTLALTNSPGTTVSQRAATRASFLNDPSADTFGGLVLGFNITRQIR